MAFIKKCGLEDRFIKTEKKGQDASKEKEGQKEKAVMIVQEKKGDPSHPLYGKNVMFTGFRPKELMASLKDLGAKIGSSVSKKTFVLVVKDADEDSGKVSKAKELGVPVMVVDKFREKYMK